MNIKLSQYLKAITQLSTLSPTPYKTADVLARLRTILGKYGHPEQRQNRYVHVTGTNGKGSVALKIAKGLELSGYKTGLFVSPHLFSFRQRMKINSQLISTHRFVELFHQIEPHITEEKLSFFEIICLMSLIYYEEQKCDKVVLQVGIGGTLDTTNIITSPIVTVATSIGFDHIELLGNSLDSIAENKAGIMKKGRPMVIGSQCQPYHVFEKKAKNLGCPLFILEKSSSNSFQNSHNKIVGKVFQVLENQGIKLSSEAKQSAFKERQECRKQYIPQSCLPMKNQTNKNYVILDVGHNPPALLKLFETLRQNHPNNKFIVIYGTSKMKNSQKTLKNILPFSKEIFLVSGNHFRSMDIQTLKQNSKDLEGVESVENGDVQKTIAYALLNCKQNDIIVICGSFFIMKEAKGYFYPKEIQERSDPDTRSRQLTK